MRTLIILGAIFLSATALAEVEVAQRDISNFSEVTVKGSMNVHLVQGDEYSVLVETDADWQEWVSTEVSDQELLVTLRKGRPSHWFSNEPEVEVFITLPELEAVNVNGSGGAYLGNIEGNELRFKINGSGELNAKQVVADELQLEVNGSGDVAIATAGAKFLKVHVKGSGDVSVDELVALESDVIIKGSGDVSMGGETSSQLVSIYGSGDFHGNSLRAEDVEVTIYGSGDVWIATKQPVHSTVRGSGDIHITN